MDRRKFLAGLFAGGAAKAAKLLPAGRLATLMEGVAPKFARGGVFKGPLVRVGEGLRVPSVRLNSIARDAQGRIIGEPINWAGRVPPKLGPLP